MTDAHEMSSQADASALTERTREEAERTWALLVEAYDGRAWAALGYRSWDDYILTEFDTATSPAFRLLERARVGLGEDVEDVEDGEAPAQMHLSPSETQEFLNQVVLSLEALTMGLDMVDLSTLPDDEHAAGVIAEAIATFTRMLQAVSPDGRPED